MTFDPREPYNELPLLPPAVELETKAVQKKCIAANKALAELKGAGDLIPNQAILINAIPLQEARRSSEIENIVTTQDELFRAALDERHPADPQTKEVLRYCTALRHGYEAVKRGPVSAALLAQLCGILRDEPVSFRIEERVYIGSRAAKTVTYTPPVGEAALRGKLANLEQYMRTADDVDPLVRMAVAQYQFEAIHPFTDGNGRTGRILNMLLLQSRLLRIPVLYLSRYLVRTRPDYYRLLRGVTERGDWQAWLLYMLTAMDETARWTTARIEAIRELLERTLARCRQQLPKHVYSKELIEAIFTLPYCRIQVLVDAGIAQRQAASQYLRALEGIGILVGERRGRQVIYKHPALLEALSA
jgi:Fic family protein